MKYISTRNKNKTVSGAEAIAMGISDEGGLFVPESFPKITKADRDKMAAMSYAERTAFSSSERERSTKD